LPGFSICPTDLSLQAAACGRRFPVPNRLARIKHAPTR
jgi:hypothetical protein